MNATDLTERLADPTVFEALCRLLRCGLCNEEWDADRFERMTARQWSLLFDMAARGGVLAICYGVIQPHLDSLDLSPETALNWAIGSRKIETRSQRQLAAAIRLREIYATSDIDMLILKGLSLARYYPRPALRECGDVDFYPLGGHELANRIAVRQGAVMQHGADKHDSFLFEGVLFENHARLFDRDFAVDRLFEQMIATSPDDLRRRMLFSPDGFGFLTPTYNALFLLRHTSSHFATSGIAVRHLCDWGLMLATEGDAIDLQRYRSAVERSGMQRMNDVLTRLAAQILDLDLSRFVVGGVPDSLSRRALADILLYGRRMPRPDGAVRLTIFKLRRLVRRRWKYRLLMPESFARVVMHSIKHHLLKPTKPSPKSSPKPSDRG